MATLQPEIQNENTKFIANAFDRVSTAFVTSGILGPFFSALSNPNMDDAHIKLVVFGGIFCILCALGIHWRAREVMKALAPK